MQILDETVKTAVTDRLQKVEAHLEGDKSGSGLVVQHRLE
jgi:hypothetical protein